MLRFEENLRIWLKDYSKIKILAKCVSFRAYNHNNFDNLIEHQFRFLPLILKYGLLYGKQGFPGQGEEISDAIWSKILKNLAKWDEKFDQEPFSASEPMKRQVGILKCRQLAYRILPCQESSKDLFFKLLRYFHIFLEDWPSHKKASTEFNEKYEFSIKDYFRVCCVILSVLLTSNKNYKDFSYEILDLLYFDVDKLTSNIKEEYRSSNREQFCKILDTISTSFEGVEEKVKENNLSLTELQRFYDYSFFEEKYPLIKCNDRYIIPFPYLLIDGSWRIMYRLLVDCFGKSRLKDKGKLHFTEALEKHLFLVAKQLASTIDPCQVYTEDDHKKLGVYEKSQKADLVIEFKNSMFLFECKTVEPDKYLKFSLNRQEFIQGFYGKSLYKALNQLITCANIIQESKTKKQSFMFVVTLEELYLPNFKVLKEIILDDALIEFLKSKILDETEKSKLIETIDLINTTNLKNIFFISIHEFNMLMNGLKIKKYTIGKLCEALQQSSKRDSPFPFLRNYTLASTDGRSTSSATDPTQELIKNLPFEESNKSTWVSLSEDIKSLLKSET